METIHILITTTAVLSLIIATIWTVITLFNRKSLKTALNLFIYSFLGGLFGAFIGSLLGLAIGYVVALITDYQGFYMYGNWSDLYIALGILAVFLICWFLGTLIGGIKTIKPFTKLFRSQDY